MDEYWIVKRDSDGKLLRYIPGSGLSVPAGFRLILKGGIEGTEFYVYGRHCQYWLLPKYWALQRVPEYEQQND